MIRSLAAALAAASLCAAGGGFSERKYFYEDIYSPFFVKEGRLYRSAREHSSPASFPAQKPPGGLRVFVLGGSIAQLHMTNKGSLSEALRAVLPGTPVEVVGCGMNGYDSYREALILDEILDYSPDLIVLMTGHNEALGARPIPLWVLRAGDGLARVKEFMSSLGADLRPALNKSDLAAAAIRRDAEFERNLREMIRRARARGSAVLLLSPPLNRVDAPPDTPPPAQDPGFMSAWVAELRGDRRAAAAGFDELIRRGREGGTSPPSLYFHAYLKARAYQDSGMESEARQAYEEALSLADQDRCSPACQATLHRIAREEGALWADADAALRAAAAPALPGLDHFDDNVHWRRELNPLVSSAMVSAMRRSERFSALPWDDRRLGDFETMAGRPHKAPGTVDLERTLGYAGSSMPRQDGKLSWRSVLLLRWARERKPSWFEDPARLSRRLRQKPVFGSGGPEVPGPRWAALVLWHLGAMEMERKDFSKARALLEDAVRGDAPPGASVTLAMAQALGGDPEAARLTLKRASERGAGDEASAAARALGLD